MRLAVIAVAVLAACGSSDDDMDTPPDSGGVATAEVTARAETDSSVGDPDDPAIWIHPDDPARSRILGTDKTHGLYVYDLDGRLVQDLPDGRMNSVDLRRFDGDGGAVTLVTTGNRTNDTIAFYTLDAVTGMLARAEPIAGLPAGLTIYGHCMGREADGTVHVFFDAKDGTIVQWRLGTDDGAITGTEVRRLQVGSQPENCVVDDELGRLYVGEEDVGIWRFDAFGTSTQGTLIATADGHHMVADVEGLAIYRPAGGADGGYLVASSQGDNAYALFERGGDNAFVSRFRIVDGAVDAASESDGIEVTAVALPGYDGGMFIAHDTANEGFTGNFKLVAWDDIAQKLP
jgi:3-phytase